MKYDIQLKKRAVKDLGKLPTKDRDRMIERLELLADDLKGDVKHLTNHSPEYRMRSGDWRALFEVEKKQIIVYRIINRREAYK